MLQCPRYMLMVLPNHLIAPCAGKHRHQNFQRAALICLIQHIGGIGLIRQCGFRGCYLLLRNPQTGHICLMDIHFAIQGIMHHIGEACHQCLVLCFHHAHRKYLRILQKITIILHHIKTESVLAQCPFAQFLYKGLFQVPVPDRLCHCI